MTRWRRARFTAAALAAVTVTAAATAASCRSAGGPAAPAAPVASTRAEDAVAAPLLRIGVLTGAARASLGADSGLSVGAPRQARRSVVARATFRPAPGPGAPRVRLIETGELFEVALVVPVLPGDPSLAAEAVAYRGVFEVRAETAETLSVVNVVNLEDYLRGVVPNELSPSVYPELEALKAQAVAARTYALRNLGQYQAKGYDLCATAACQVYRGRGSEHALTDEAVEATAGVTAVYAGAPINALYTSTCGGHTEDAANIFEGETQPYLRGVLCGPERALWGSVRTTAPREALGPQEGLNRDVALLAALGVIEAPLPNASALRATATEAEARAWPLRLAAALRRKPCPSPVEPPLLRRASFFQNLVATLCWADRAQRLLGDEEADYLLQVEDASGFSGIGERRAAALLLQEGILAAVPDNALHPNVAISRGAALQLLAGAARRAGPPALRSAGFRRAEPAGIVVEHDGQEEPLALDHAVALFRTLDGRSAAASEIALAPGDRLAYVARQGKVVFLEVEQPRAGLASDRSSRYYRWETRLTPAEVARSVARYGNVGEVQDVEVRRLGVSGRVVEVAIVGTRGEVALRGLRVRWGLGLRENLFVIDRERDPDGSGVASFVFTGKGWGHGVGLCQVGAVGMAQTGARYEAILEHYYSGIRLAHAAGRPATH